MTTGNIKPTRPPPPISEALQEDVKVLSDKIRSTYTDKEVAMASLHVIVNMLMASHSKSTGRDISHLAALNATAVNFFSEAMNIDNERVSAAVKTIERDGKTIDYIASLPQ